MGEDDMIGTRKLRRRISGLGKAKKPEMEKTISQRNPLGEINAISIPPIQVSAEVQRKGCFRFLRPSSSSKEDFIPRSNSKPRTPKSAPPSSKNLSSRAIVTDPSSLRIKTRQKPISENPQNLRSKEQANPAVPDLFRRRNQPRPSSRGFSGGKFNGQERISNVGFKGKNGSQGKCTPGRTNLIEGVKPPDSKVKEDKQLSATPPSNSTPPIQASISPEVPCGIALSPIPVCFATGHVMAGVLDRRKCRPRGILTIGEEQSNLSGISSVSPPCAEASVCWFASPLKIGNGNRSYGSSSKVQTFDFPNEGSNNLLLSPNGAVEQVAGSSSIVPHSSILDSKLEVETTPSYCTDILRTPTSGSSISPFSMIVQRAETSSELRVFTSHGEKEGHRYGNALDISPFSAETWSNSGAVSTPSSYTKSRRKGVISPVELNSAREDLEALSLSSRSASGKLHTDVLSLNSLSFKFGCQPTDLDSIDLNCFKNSRCNELSKVEMNKKNFSASDVRVSWREGLISRIFELGELDSDQSFFVDDEYTDYLKDGNESALENGCSTFEKGNGFGSYEFPSDSNKIGVQMCKSSVPPLQSNSIAESISTEGVLYSSGDSDWTLFYKNNLFEV